MLVDQYGVGFHEGGLIQSALFVQRPLRIQRRQAAEAGRGDRLPVVLVGDITGGEHALDRSLRGAAAEPGADLQVTVVHRQLALEPRSAEHTSELQSLMRISFAAFCLKQHNNESSLNSSQYFETIMQNAYTTIT